MLILPSVEKLRIIKLLKRGQVDKSLHYIDKILKEKQQWSNVTSPRDGEHLDWRK